MALVSGSISLLHLANGIRDTSKLKLHFCKHWENPDGLECTEDISRHRTGGVSGWRGSGAGCEPFDRVSPVEHPREGSGSRLFERQSGGYALTPLGEELRDIANRVDGAFNDMERHIAGRDVQPKGKVRITAPNNLAYRYLPDYLADFNRSYPDIKVELLVSNLEVNMNSRQADIAVRVTDAPPEHLVGRQVRSIGWSVYGSAAYREKYGFPGDLDALQHHRLIGASGGMQHLPAFVWVERNLAQCVSARSDDLVAMSSLARVATAWPCCRTISRDQNWKPCSLYRQARHRTCGC